MCHCLFVLWRPQLLRQAALCKYAYVALELEDYRVADEAAQSLLSMPSCCEPWASRARLYACEAACHLQQPERGMRLLDLRMLSHATAVVNSELRARTRHSTKGKKRGSGSGSGSGGEGTENDDPVQDEAAVYLEGGAHYPLRRPAAPATRRHNGTVKHAARDMLPPPTTTFTAANSPVVDTAPAPRAAAAAYFGHIASASVLLGNLATANQFAQWALRAAPSSVHARRAAVYLSLRCGEQRDALTLLKLGQIPPAYAAALSRPAVLGCAGLPGEVNQES